MPYRDLLTDHYFTSMDKQLSLADWLKVRGNPNWDFDMQTGRLGFAPVAEFPVQLLGTEGERSGTWLWSWANHMSKIPPAMCFAAESLRSYGESHNIRELTQPEFKLDDWRHGHHLAMLASGILNANAYYRGPYSGGALFLLIHDPDYPLTPDKSPAHVLSFITQMLERGVMVDLRRAIRGYLKQADFQVAEHGGTVMGTAPDGSVVQVDFDDMGRVTQIGGTLKDASG
jgi:hypothetical protein